MVSPLLQEPVVENYDPEEEAKFMAYLDIQEDEQIYLNREDDICVFEDDEEED